MSIVNLTKKAKAYNLFLSISAKNKFFSKISKNFLTMGNKLCIMIERLAEKAYLTHLLIEN